MMDTWNKSDDCVPTLVATVAGTAKPRATVAPCRIALQGCGAAGGRDHRRAGRAQGGPPSVGSGRFQRHQLCHDRNHRADVPDSKAALGVYALALASCSWCEASRINLFRRPILSIATAIGEMLGLPIWEARWFIPWWFRHWADRHAGLGRHSLAGDGAGKPDARGLGIGGSHALSAAAGLRPLLHVCAPFNSRWPWRST